MSAHMTTSTINRVLWLQNYLVDWPLTYSVDGDGLRFDTVQDLQLVRLIDLLNAPPRLFPGHLLPNQRQLLVDNPSLQRKGHSPACLSWQVAGFPVTKKDRHVKLMYPLKIW